MKPDDQEPIPFLAVLLPTVAVAEVGVTCTRQARDIQQQGGAEGAEATEKARGLPVQTDRAMQAELPERLFLLAAAVELRRLAPIPSRGSKAAMAVLAEKSPSADRQCITVAVAVAARMV